MLSGISECVCDVGVLVWVLVSVCTVCVWCSGAGGFALAVFILSVFPRSLSPPSRHCVLHQPPSILRASRRLVCSFFSFVTPLFQKASLIETERNKIEKKKIHLKDTGVDLKWNDIVSKTKRVDFSKAATMMKWSAYAAECIDCIVRPCVQNPWYCLHSPINVFCMEWSCCHGDPRIGRLKRGDVCMEGVREKEKGAPLACLLTDGLTQEHGTVCVHAYWYARIVILLNLLSCHVYIYIFFWIIMCNIASQLPCHHIFSNSALVALSGNLALAVMLVHALLFWSCMCCAGL